MERAETLKLHYFPFARCLHCNSQIFVLLLFPISVLLLLKFILLTFPWFLYASPLLERLTMCMTVLGNFCLWLTGLLVTLSKILVALFGSFY